MWNGYILYKLLLSYGIMSIDFDEFKKRNVFNFVKVIYFDNFIFMEVKFLIF